MRILGLLEEWSCLVAGCRHDYCGVKEDLETYWPKLKTGGLAWAWSEACFDYVGHHPSNWAYLHASSQAQLRWLLPLASQLASQCLGSRCLAPLTCRGAVLAGGILAGHDYLTAGEVAAKPGNTQDWSGERAWACVCTHAFHTACAPDHMCVLAI